MKKIQLTQGKFAFVDDCDFDALSQYKWIYNNGYAVRASRINDPGYKHGGLVMMHRQITDCPDDKQVDHINHEKCDNRRVNLRICTRSENMWNKVARKNKVRTKYKGVSWHKASQKWGVVFQKKWVGCFDTDIEGAKEFDKRAKEYYGEFAYLNFPE